MQYSADAAETFAIRVLTWLLNQDELLPVFLGATGASEQDLRSRAGDPDFLGSVLDFLMMDDAWVIRFCESEAVPYEHPMLARAALPGGAQTHWT